jgi:hypothetical protein
LVDLAEIQAAYYMVAATGVLIAAVFYLLNLRISQRNQELSLKTQELALKSQQQNLETRQAQLFMVIYHDLYSRDLVLARYKLDSIKDWNDFLDLWNDQEKRIAMNTITGCFEGIGVLVRENLVDIRLVSLLSSGLITGFWEKFGPYFLQYREKFDYPRLCIEFEYLNNRIIEYGREHPELQIVPKLMHALPDNET